MIRIRGRVGNCPIELDIELDAQDWMALGAAVHASPSEPEAAESSPQTSGRSSAEAFWAQAKQLVQSSGSIAGPALLVQLEALCGNVQQAKQLMVRLRHSAEVVVERHPDALLYRWQG